MSLLDDVFHSIYHLRTTNDIWDTLCVQYEGTAVRLYLKFMRFNCLLIDLNTIDIVYANSEVVTKFMQTIPKYWETYTMCLTMYKDIKTSSLSESYAEEDSHKRYQGFQEHLRCFGLKVHTFSYQIWKALGTKSTKKAKNVKSRILKKLKVLVFARCLFGVASSATLGEDSLLSALVSRSYLWRH
ncbi:hypothetical protein OSB04_005750 [Centaurea solstitialis]|uniref:Uncharacterized protein n=1 Tax=Centaurea solstitialis TaxID=347529 RepID=A0AA38TTB0_9ASTR|nr:hypothetical protein OSB04_005750 [Centaurea solstitialis]